EAIRRALVQRRERALGVPEDLLRRQSRRNGTDSADGPARVSAETSELQEPIGLPIGLDRERGENPKARGARAQSPSEPDELACWIAVATCTSSFLHTRPSLAAFESVYHR